LNQAAFFVFTLKTELAGGLEPPTFPVTIGMLYQSSELLFKNKLGS
jgi:hypothetical protein